jgi:prefoldin beta subunit
LGVELQNAVASRQKLEGQKQENVGVQQVKCCLEISHAWSNKSQEFERLQEGETIYKLAGPVLLKQDKFEAENTVKGRLDFISGEM